MGLPQLPRCAHHNRHQDSHRDRPICLRHHQLKYLQLQHQDQRLCSWHLPLGHPLEDLPDRPLWHPLEGLQEYPLLGHPLESLLEHPLGHPLYLLRQCPLSLPLCSLHHFLLRVPLHFLHQHLPRSRQRHLLTCHPGCPRWRQVIFPQLTLPWHQHRHQHFFAEGHSGNWKLKSRGLPIGFGGYC